MRSHADTEEVDFVIVGTGAGGGTLACKLAEAGFSVVALDAGAYWRPLENMGHFSAINPHLPGQLSATINSLRVIEASAGAGNTNSVSPVLAASATNPGGVAGGKGSARWFNKSAIAAAKAVPENERTKVLFDQLLDVKKAEAA